MKSIQWKKSIAIFLEINLTFFKGALKAFTVSLGGWPAA